MWLAHPVLRRSGPALIAALLLMSAGCGSDSGGEATPTVPPGTATPAAATPTPSPAPPAVLFTSSSGRIAGLTVEIADTADERAVGLMHRESLPENAGMLFAWTEDTSSAFYMKDTLIPLSVAFIDAGGVIIHIEDMQPLDESLHYPPGPYRYGVEANQGWFAENGIAAGDTVTLPEM